ncbi:MAG: autotransporter domain-containing protein [Gammaproteobacteria bacterium]|nr:autotransporter domain-containing protein [Gammaproteobacteria bacterium]
MVRFKLTITAIILASLSLFAIQAQAAVNVGLQVGAREDNFDWNIAAPYGYEPNVLSELTWSNLEITELRLDTQFVAPIGVAVYGTLGYGTITSGQNQDSDYDFDDRRGEYSRSNNNASDGDTLDMRIGAGYQFKIGRHVSLIPLAGVEYRELNLVMTDGFQTIPAYGPFDGLNSTYNSEWKGLWVGARANVDLRRVRFNAEFLLRTGDYYGYANWNLRSDFSHPKSFDHDSAYLGYELNGGAEVMLVEHLYLTTNLMWASSEILEGTDTIYAADGNEYSTDLNGGQWDQLAFRLGLRAAF